MKDRQADIDNDVMASKAKAAFDRSVDSLDAATLSRLNQNRHRALDQVVRHGPTVAVRQWLPAAGVAGAAFVAVALWAVRGPQLDSAPPAAASDLEIILELDDFEMLENLEFYSWIEFEESSESNVG